MDSKVFTWIIFFFLFSIQIQNTRKKSWQVYLPRRGRVSQIKVEGDNSLRDSLYCVRSKQSYYVAGNRQAWVARTKPIFHCGHHLRLPTSPAFNLPQLYLPFIVLGIYLFVEVGRGSDLKNNCGVWNLWERDESQFRRA